MRVVQPVFHSGRRSFGGPVTVLRDGRELPVGLSVEGEEPVPDDL